MSRNYVTSHLTARELFQFAAGHNTSFSSGKFDDLKQNLERFIDMVHPEGESPAAPAAFGDRSRSLGHPTSISIYVEAYSGYRANERPRRFMLEDEVFDILQIEHRWYEPAAQCFRVKTTNGKGYILRYNEQDEEWTLQSGLDGRELLKRSQVEIIHVSGEIVRAAERRIAACECCRPDDVETTFDHVLDDVTERSGRKVEYLMIHPAKCPYCRGDISEETFVQLQDDNETSA